MDLVIHAAALAFALTFPTVETARPRAVATTAPSPHANTTRFTAGLHVAFGTPLVYQGGADESLGFLPTGGARAGLRFTPAFALHLDLTLVPTQPTITLDADSTVKQPARRTGPFVALSPMLTLDPIPGLELTLGPSLGVGRAVGGGTARLMLELVEHVGVGAEVIAVGGSFSLCTLAGLISVDL